MWFIDVTYIRWILEFGKVFTTKKEDRNIHDKFAVLIVDVEGGVYSSKQVCLSVCIPCF